MKFQVTMKTPDCLDGSIRDAVRGELDGQRFEDSDEKQDARQNLEDEAYAAAVPFFRYCEQVTLEIDTVTKTCVVVRTGF